MLYCMYGSIAGHRDHRSMHKCTCAFIASWWHINSNSPASIKCKRPLLHFE